MRQNYTKRKFIITFFYTLYLYYLYSKYNKGRRRKYEKEWLFGGIKRGSKDCFMVPVGKRNKETLLPIIFKYMKPGTTVISDEWKAYKALINHNYAHKSVNHSINFVSPDDPIVHTQNIENLWSVLKRKRPRNTHGSHSSTHLDQFLYWRNFPQTNNGLRFLQICEHISTCYPGFYGIKLVFVDESD
jgi:hypothetical protein